MARTWLGIFELADRASGSAIRAPYRVELRNGGAATVYAADSGGTTIPANGTSDTLGRMAGWVEPNSYRARVFPDLPHQDLFYFEATGTGGGGGGSGIDPNLGNAKGDLIVYSADNVPDRLGIGANNTVLTADNTQPQGARWGTVPTSGIQATILTAKGQLLGASGSGSPAPVPAGAEGQVLKARGAAFTGTAWEAEAGGASGIPASIGDARGDLIGFSANDTPVKVPAGAAGDVLTSVGAFATTGVSWETPTQPSTDWFNVKNAPYNATGNGSTNDAPAIQAAIDDAAAQGGGVVYFPFGVYRCTATLTVPPMKAITLMGSGKHRLWGGQHSTKLLRDGGTHPLLVCIGTGGITSRALMDVVDMELNGNSLGTTGNGLVQLACGSDVSWRRVNVVFTSGRGLYLQNLWNCVFYDVAVRGCGSDGVNPAMMLWSSEAGPENIDSAWFMACQWEANHGTEIFIDGQVSPSQQIHFLGGKIERSSGLAPTAPLVQFRRCNYVSFTGFRFINQVGTGPHVRSLLNDGRMRHFANCHFETGSVGSPPWSGPYFIDQQIGDIHLANCGFFGAAVPTTAYWRIGSSVSWAGAMGTNLWYEGSVLAIQDQRSGARMWQNGIQRQMSNLVSWDPGAIANGETASTSVHVGESRVGDCVSVGLSSLTALHDPRLILHGRVVTQGFVLVYLTNLTGSSQTVGSGTLHVNASSAKG